MSSPVDYCYPPAALHTDLCLKTLSAAMTVFWLHAHFTRVVPALHQPSTLRVRFYSFQRTGNVGAAIVCTATIHLEGLVASAATIFFPSLVLTPAPLHRWAGNIWASTGCTSDISGDYDFPATSKCVTNNCPANGICQDYGGPTGVTTKAEFAMIEGGLDFYDVSIIDGRAASSRLCRWSAFRHRCICAQTPKGSPSRYVGSRRLTREFFGSRSDPSRSLPSNTRGKDSRNPLLS